MKLLTLRILGKKVNIRKVMIWQNRAKKEAFIWRINPQPIASDYIKVQIRSNSNTSNVIIEQYSVSGEKLKVLWKSSLFRGVNFATANLSEFNPGIYIINLKNEAGETLDFKKIL